VLADLVKLQHQRLQLNAAARILPSILQDGLCGRSHQQPALFGSDHASVSVKLCSLGNNLRLNVGAVIRHSVGPIADAVVDHHELRMDDLELRAGHDWLNEHGTGRRWHAKELVDR
jgi:acyl transferase domain-containing protein